MIDTYEIYEELVPNLGDAPARSIARVVGKVYRDLSQAVTRDDFNRLVVVVGELAEAQKKTEERLDLLSQRVEELAEAQKRTEQRLEELAEAQKRTEQRVEELAQAQKKTEERLDRLSQRVEELAEAQKRTEQRLEELAEAQKKTEERLNSLSQRVEELAEAQKRTEQRLEELAEAQKKTEERLNSLSQRVEELAEAQKRTEQRVEELAEAQKRTEQRLDILTEKVEFLHGRIEDLSDSVGYSIENRAYQALPSLLEQQGIIVQGDLIRRYIGEHQINVFGKARRENQDVTILGECKTRLSKKEINRFERIVNRLKQEGKVVGEIVTIFIAHDFPPEVEAHLIKKKALYFWSYQFK